jgi:hypothetical protein
MIGKGFSALNSLRQQLMLSGLAVPKSLLGNVGAGVIASAERRSLAPIREVLSPATLREFIKTYKANVPYPGATRVPGPTPGRVMGAADVATRQALQRAGLTEAEAAGEVLQTPLGGQLGEALDSPAARYLIPFRRTPFNQFLEGLKTLSKENIRKNPALLAAVGSAGAAHGAATSEERYPLTLGLGTAASARYGLPYALGAIAGRHLAGGRTGGSIAGTMLPVSEFGIETGITDPLRPFTDPAALVALRRLSGGR